MREGRNAYLRYTKHHLIEQADERFDCLDHNAFDLVNAPPLMLREHFRCHEDIAAYFNDEYYTGKLKVRTNKAQLKFPENMGFKRALVWKDVHDSLDEEIGVVKEVLHDLKKNQYTGEIGVISPFRQVAARLKQELHSFRSLLDVEKDVNTANGFQGGERDVVFLVLGITSKLTTVPHLFHHNALVVLANGVDAKLGSLSSRFEHFHEWKRLVEDQPGVVDMETLLKGVCGKENFLDLVENFIVFDDSAGQSRKILARNHQFLGVNRAVEAVRNRKYRNGKLVAYPGFGQKLFDGYVHSESASEARRQFHLSDPDGPRRFGHADIQDLRRVRCGGQRSGPVPGFEWR